MSEPVHLSYGVWRSSEAVSDLAGRAAALLTACAPGTVIAGMTAARLHNLWLPSVDPEPAVHVIVHPEIATPSARSNTRRSAVRARRRVLAPNDITMQCGLPVTTEARTWFDLASVLGLDDLVAAGDSALRGCATTTELHAVVERARYCPGVVAARRALPHLDARSRSRPESLLRFGLVSRGLPPSGVNQPIHTRHGEWLAEPDLSYDDARLALEYNGGLHADAPRMRKDITRGLDILDEGWLTVVVGPVQVFRRMDQVAETIRRLRQQRTSGTPGTVRPLVAHFRPSGAELCANRRNLRH